jgi:hypothetical protein
MPDASKTTAHPAVNRIRNGDGSMKHATIEAPADKAAQI